MPLLVPPVHKFFLLLYRIFIFSGSLFYYHFEAIWLSFILAYIHKEKIDTDTPTGKFMLTVFAALSQLEREQLKQRQREGIEIAKAQGVYAVAPEPSARTFRATLPHFESHFHGVESHKKNEPARLITKRAHLSKFTHTCG